MMEDGQGVYTQRGPLRFGWESGCAILEAAKAAWFEELRKDDSYFGKNPEAAQAAVGKQPVTTAHVEAVQLSLGTRNCLHKIRRLWPSQSTHMHYDT